MGHCQSTAKGVSKTISFHGRSGSLETQLSSWLLHGCACLQCSFSPLLYVRLCHFLEERKKPQQPCQPDAPHTSFRASRICTCFFFRKLFHVNNIACDNRWCRIFDLS